MSPRCFTVNTLTPTAAVTSAMSVMTTMISMRLIPLGIARERIVHLRADNARRRARMPRMLRVVVVRRLREVKLHELLGSPVAHVVLGALLAIRALRADVELLRVLRAGDQVDV